MTKNQMKEFFINQDDCEKGEVLSYNDLYVDYE